MIIKKRALMKHSGMLCPKPYKKASMMRIELKKL